MNLCGLRLGFATLTLAALLVCPSRARAQSVVELSPFYGYRFGGGFFELVTGRPVDLDGAPAAGVTLNIPIWEQVQLEGHYSHQKANVIVPTLPAGSETLFPITVDHWLGGGLQEFRPGRVRPFLTGSLGLTRYAVEGDSEIRFSLAAGGGVKLYPWKRVGVRLDGRVFSTFVDADGTLIACTIGVCLVSLDVNIVWQAEFTAGLIVRFP